MSKNVVRKVKFMLTNKNKRSIMVLVIIMERFILHIDVNNAFLSWTAVERLKNGETVDIRTIPAVIGGSEEDRKGIVLAKSPVAKQFGIKTGEPLYFARKKCPQIQVFASDFKTYRKYSNQMIEILKEYTDQIEQVSIDECSIDLTRFLMKGESVEDKAKQISTEIKEKLGFTVNIGISHNKMLAKMASDFEKPDKIHTLYENEIPTKMWPLPISDLLMVGKRTIPKLEKIGIKTIGDLAKRSETDIIKRFGKLGKTIWEYANGIDNSPVQVRDEKPKGIGNSVTLPHDVEEIEKLDEVLLALCEQVAYRLRKQEMLANVVNVQIKTNTFDVFSHQKKIPEPTDSTKYIYSTAKELLSTLYKSTTNKKVRLLGVRVDSLVDKEEMQLSLFSQVDKDKEKQKKLDNTVDNLKEKYGYDSITRAGKMNINKFIRLKD